MRRQSKTTPPFPQELLGLQITRLNLWVVYPFVTLRYRRFPELSRRTEGRKSCLGMLYLFTLYLMKLHGIKHLYSSNKESSSSKRDRVSLSENFVTLEISSQCLKSVSIKSIHFGWQPINDCGVDAVKERVTSWSLTLIVFPVHSLMTNWLVRLFIRFGLNNFSLSIWQI